MKIELKTPEQVLPDEYQQVLVCLHGDAPKSEKRWALAVYAHDTWTPSSGVVDSDQTTSESGSSSIDPARVVYWAELPTADFQQSVIAMSEVKPSPVPQVRFHAEDGTIDIFGEPSPYTEAAPYYLRPQQYRSSSSALEAMAQVASKTWATRGQFLFSLATALSKGLASQT